MTADSPSRAAGADARVAAACAGDRRAFDALCHPQAQQRWLVLIGMEVPGRLRAKFDAEDVLQVTLERAWRDIATLRDASERGFDRWIIGIARHVTTDHIRRFRQQKRDPTREEGYHLTAADAGEISAATPSRVFARREQADQIIALLEELKPNYRAVIIYRIFENYNTKEVAERMDTSVENVSVLLHRALIRIRDLMEERGIVSGVFDTR